MNEGRAGALADREVIRLVRKGHVDYFRILIDRYQSRIYSIGIRFLKNREDALDFTQEVFLKDFEALPGFRGASSSQKGSFAGWITRIAYRYGINTVKRRKIYVSMAEGYEPSGKSNPEEDHLRKNISAALKDAVRGLSAGQKMCIDLSFFYGLTYGEISEVTGISENTVKSHIFRAKKILKKRLRGTEAEDYNDL